MLRIQIRLMSVQLRVQQDSDLATHACQIPDVGVRGVLRRQALLRVDHEVNMTVEPASHAIVKGQVRSTVVECCECVRDQTEVACLSISSKY